MEMAQRGGCRDSLWRPSKREAAFLRTERRVVCHVVGLRSRLIGAR